ncbi:YadA-like family protein [Qipengyuania qiaonensis]|nr:YadA-like family protein [Qipengyuania qiaonensis]
MTTTALIGAGVAIPSTPAHAQALQPVVDVCTGITLPRSAVTEIIGAVNEPIVTPLENTLNALTSLSVILPPLAIIPDFDIDLSTILADAAAGAPISLQILDTDGNVVGASDDCNIRADNITLDTEGGIEIGGNRISGLGANGQEATAGEADAIAFGNNASTAIGATGAIALGTNASATAANSVALGAGSVADRVNSVSVGAVGAERQITNVLAGTADTDAATVGQVNASIAAATANGVVYDSAAQTSITLGGAGGTTIANVAAGTLSSTSTEAVNGSQLFATNQTVAALGSRVDQNEVDIAQNRADINDIQNNIGQIQVTVGEFDGRITQNETDIANIDGRVTVNETDIANLDGRVTVNEGDIANLDSRVTVNQTNIAQVQAQVDNIPVGYVSDADGSTPSTTPTNTAAFGGAAAGGVRVTNVAAATLSAGSTDVVNGSQLFATNQAVQQNTDDIQTINNNLAGSTVVAVQYSDPDNPTVSNGGTITNDVTLIGRDAAAPVALHNIADATAATDAVNLRQMEAGLANVLADSMGYTDMRIAQIGFDLAELRDDAFSGTASAMALASIPQAVEQGKMMIGGGVGHYRGETSFGFGMSSTFADGQAVLKVSGTIGANGKGGVAAGAGFAF